MNDWTQGYVVDTDYTRGVYGELSPVSLSFACLVADVRGPDASAPLNYCELGCGQGHSTILHAAANPHINFYANDFNPAHVSQARSFAAQAGLTNVSFSDASFADYDGDLDRAVQFDMICLHGVYSWVSPANRAAIVSFVRKRLKLGGLFYISYNCQPGAASSAPLRHLFHLQAQSSGGPTLDRVGPALAFAGQVSALGAKYFKENAGVDGRLQQLKGMDPRYIVHEYLNLHWNSFYFSEIHAEMAEAKLAFVSSATLIETIGNISFTPAQLDMLNGISDVGMRETIKDYFRNQRFRRDLFVKGAVRLSRAEAREAWLSARFVAVTPRRPNELEINASAGRVSLKPEIYNPVLEALAEGPATVADLMAEPSVAALGFEVLREALTLLAGLGRIKPALEARDDDTRIESTHAMNSMIMHRAQAHHDVEHLVSPVTGATLAVGRVELLLLLARGQKAADPARHVAALFQASRETLVKDGTAISDAAELERELRQNDDALQARLPILRQLAVV